MNDLDAFYKTDVGQALAEFDDAWAYDYSCVSKSVDEKLQAAVDVNTRRAKLVKLLIELIKEDKHGSDE
jgi:hypothetical protein